MPRWVVAFWPIEANKSVLDFRERKHDVPHQPKYRVDSFPYNIKDVFGGWSVSSQVACDCRFRFVLLPSAVALFDVRVNLAKAGRVPGPFCDLWQMGIVIL